MLDAIDGAVALAPELAPKADAMRAAAEGVAALLTESLADTVAGNAQEALARFATPLKTVAAPLFEAALILDPSIGKKPSA
jgi:hypothetical protein